MPGLSGDLDDDASPYGQAVTKAFEIFDAHEWRVEGAAETRTKLRQFLDTVKSAANRQRGSNQDINATENQNRDEPFFTGQGDVFGNIDLSDALWVPQLDGMMYF
ncbi:hypothetical protein NW762_012100 [Fusarium torreyae]|uniref:Uncharacterized protein n=1 Tax=Fusarium torreyae TaxID=1237075 RepID=A0A9W8RN12_9HYPO|nr:hypothetical protein NW762_012100 [Fusarium torreyae]